MLDETSCRQAIQNAVERFGRLDILVNNAGTTVRKQPEDLTAQDWHLVMNTNLTGAFLCSQAAYPHMVRAGGGKIINIGSMMSVFASSYAAPYAASKAGIVQLAKSMAVSWAKDNIQVNAILPGWIDTELTQGARKQVQGLHEKVLARTPAQRWAYLPAILRGSPYSWRRLLRISSPVWRSLSTGDIEPRFDPR